MTPFMRVRWYYEHVHLKPVLEEGLSRAVLSKPRRQSPYSKVTVRPVLVDLELCYQFEYRQGTKATHANLPAPEAESLLAELKPRRVALEGHPWEHGFLLAGGTTGRLRGAAGRWTPEMTMDWTPVAPELVAEVVYDQVDVDRFRHPARFKRWRPDRDPRSCTFEQLAP
jgi:hypothetical protein